MLRNRPLLIAILALFFVLQLSLGRELMAARFDWRPLGGAPIVRATMLDFTFTIVWCACTLFDAARRQGRSGWPWLPLLLILPTVALFLFSLTSPPEEERTPCGHSPETPHG